MGRTKRRRRHRPEVSKSLENTTDCVQLRQWLAQHGWKNETRLQLRSFAQTGRGICSRRAINANDVLISIPNQLMITFNSIQTCLMSHIALLREPLKIQELLAVFLMMEVTNIESSWKEYIGSLPKELPALPWLATEDEVSLYPDEMQKISRKCHENYRNGLKRAKKLLSDALFDEELFKWGYVLVNTRAVYVDPNQLGIEEGFSSVLLDTPNMALCPFLDMFNHDFNANTEAALNNQDGQLVYQLKTLSGYRKYDQIFISYGPHNNMKLLMEYGFFIPGNVYDVVQFEMAAVLKVLGVQIDQRQYKFIKEHFLDSKLYIGYDMLSFNLKALIFVSLNGDCKNISEVVFGDKYSEEFLLRLKPIVNELLDTKIFLYKEQCKNCEINAATKSKYASMMQQFLEYRVMFVLDLKKIFDEKS
ncbi:unnamed protein product [Acanthoscelides obtectus]|uniref:SET domain-containing protein n=1 Tax=Acanthoscelides obtectus TaxID=200917 RepID=A0A9P0KIF9_ACAOB|nr:unnamed protein product [Acanthoscelides obtectus]CAK1661649.1 SET domain-containing protein 4 [Acanthoscelides obtectus]